MNCDEFDGGCDGPAFVFTLYVYIVGAVLFGLGVMFVACLHVSMEGRSHTEKTFFVLFVIFVLGPACGALWPVIVLCWLLCRAPCHIVNGVVNECARRAERAALRQRQAAISYLHQYSPESIRRWRDRGWLVMLRARHQAFLAPQQQGPQKSGLCPCRRNTEDTRGITLAPTRDPLATAGGEPSAGTRRVTDIELCKEGNSYQEHGITQAKLDDPLSTARGKLSAGPQGIVDIEQCEEGNSDQEFARAVISVVGIIEEGLFRNIVLFV